MGWGDPARDAFCLRMAGLDCGLQWSLLLLAKVWCLGDIVQLVEADLGGVWTTDDVGRLVEGVLWAAESDAVDEAIDDDGVEGRGG